MARPTWIALEDDMKKMQLVSMTTLGLRLAFSRGRVLAIIGHDNRKEELIAFVRCHLSFFRNRELVATGRTAEHLRRLGLRVTAVPHGPDGGDIVVGALVVMGYIQAVFFFQEHERIQPHDPDIRALLRVCNQSRTLIADTHTEGEDVISQLRAPSPSEVLSAPAT